MRVAIVHYHLRAGGVTRVIENATRALAETDTKTVVLCGETPSADVEIHGRVRVVPGLDYTPSAPQPDENELIRAMETAAVAELGGPPDLWHFHNHALGKNTTLTQAVRRMAEQGQRLLLQIHDFAEDGRPHLFDTLLRFVGNHDLSRLGEIAYPLGDHIHYAAINRRDMRLLVRAGADPTHVHYLPNAIVVRSVPAEPWDPFRQNDCMILYPVRAIRRKNLGEALLWCAVMRNHAHFAVTLAPKSAADRPAYDFWVAFAKRHHLPILFEVGQQSSTAFEAFLSSSWLVLTTSVAEGFGLTFFEPWLAGRPVVGRDIPWLTQDFKAQGVELPGLYTALLIPLDWIDRSALREHLRRSYAEFLACYQRPATPVLLDTVERVGLVNDHVDFGKLDETLQGQVIEHVLRYAPSVSELHPARLLDSAESVQFALTHNPGVIRELYSLEAYRQRLLNVYAAVVQSQATTIEDGLDVTRLLDFFLAPEAFWFIRT